LIVYENSIKTMYYTNGMDLATDDVEKRCRGAGHALVYIKTDIKRSKVIA
jgi:hypothetical protein